MSVAIITGYYQTILRRTPSDAEVASWNTVVQGGGLTLEQVRNAFLTSTENTNLVDPIIRLYQSAFNRQPDSAGLDHWVNVVRSGQTVAQVATLFSSQTEFTNRYGTDTGVSSAYVISLYNNILGRTPTNAEITSWTSSGLSRGAILRGFSDSPEAVTRFETAVNTLLDGVAQGTSTLSPTQPLTGTTTTATGSTFALTSGTNTFTGTASADTFNADFVNEGGTANVQTLNANDSLDGGAGNDTLNATLKADVAPISLKSIETLNVSTSTAAAVLNAVNSDSIVTIKSSGNSHALTVSNLQKALTGIELSNTNQDLTVTNAAGVSGTTDAVSLTLSAVSGGTITIGSTAANGYETLNIVSTGPSDNTLTAVTDGATATSLATINVSGSKALNMGTTLDATVTAVNASTATGNVTVTQTSTNAFTFTGGSGNDTVIMGGAYGSTDTINGGAGTGDALSVTSAIAAAIATNQTNVTNVEQLTISDALGGAVNTTYFASVNRINLSADPGNHTITIDSGDEVRFAVTTTATPDLLVGGIGTTDTATVTLASAINLGGDALTTTGIETLTVNSLGASGTTNTIHTLTMTNTAASEAVIFTGAAAITVTNAITADTVNASAMTGVFTMSADPTAAGGAGMTITGGSAAAGDVLRGSSGADIISGGAGNDNILANAGIDIVDLGAGDDTLNWTNFNAAGLLTSANRDNVTNFTATNTAFTTSSGIDRIDLGNVLTTLDISAGGTAANFQTQSAAGNVTLTNAQGFIELAFEFSSGVNLNAGGADQLNGTTLLSALGAATGTTAGTITVGTNDFDAIIIAYQGGRAFVYGSHNNDGNTGIVAAEIGLLGVFEGVAVGGFVQSNFI